MCRQSGEAVERMAGVRAGTSAIRGKARPNEEAEFLCNLRKSGTQIECHEGR